MSTPMHDLLDTASSVNQYLQNLGEEIGKMEAVHGPNSEEYREKVREWNQAMKAVGEVTDELQGIGDTIHRIKHEYGIGND